MTLPTSFPNTLVIANPKAGQKGRLRGKDPARLLRTLLPEAEIHLTRGPDDAQLVATQAAERGIKLVVAAGGDGTINEVVNGLVGSQTSLAILPLGTENVLAKERQIPMNLAKAVNYIRNTKPRPVDVGKIGSRYFLCFAGLGFDAAVVQKVNPDHKGRVGGLAYVMTAMELSLKYHEGNRKVRLTVDGETHLLGFWQILIGNIQTYGGGLRPCPRASMHDGLLDVCVFPKTDLPGILHQVVAAATGAHVNLQDMTYLQGRHFRFECDPPVLSQIDGELGPMSPIDVEVVPGGLWARF
jgi:diacylglycerol kinase (ATP)